MRTDFLSRKWRAIIFIILLAIIALGANFAHHQVIDTVNVNSIPASQIGDVKLYQNIAERVAKGEGYYGAVAAEHRAHNYPLKPFVTVRLPTLAYAIALIGQNAMRFIMLALICATTVAWFLFFRQSISSIVWLFLLAVAIPIFCFAFLLESMVMLHECWAAILIALMIGVHGRAPVWISVSIALMACMIRELAFPVLVMMAVFAVYKKHWKEAVQWGAASVLFILYLFYHAYCISNITMPGDLVSPGWGGLRGWSLLTQSIARVTILSSFIPSVTAAIIILSMFGWLNLNVAKGFYVATIISGYSVLMMVFARPNNFYWVFLLLPLIMTGAILGVVGIFRLLSPISNRSLIAALVSD